MTTDPMAAAPARLRTASGLTRFAWMVVFYNVLVIVWGALVRATGSGAGCGNHWPLCNGQVIPVTPGFHTVIEFTHRMMTGGSTFLIAALLVWVIRTTPKAHASRYFAVGSVILLLNEAILGALLVKLGYVTTNQSIGRVFVLAIHLSNTLLLLASLTLTACFSARDETWRDLRLGNNLGWGIAGALATIVVGVTGSLAALGDTLFPATSLSASFTQDFGTQSPGLLKLRLIHPISAILAAAFVLWLVVRSQSNSSAGDTPRVSRVRMVLALLAMQFVLGIADVLLLTPAWMQLLHLLGADLYWIALIAVATETIWSSALSRAVSEQK